MSQPYRDMRVVVCKANAVVGDRPRASEVRVRVTSSELNEDPRRVIAAVRRQRDAELRATGVDPVAVRWAEMWLVGDADPVTGLVPDSRLRLWNRSG